jgi:uncharacterized membrane protein YfcA
MAQPGVVGAGIAAGATAGETEDIGGFASGSGEAVVIGGARIAPNSQGSAAALRLIASTGPAPLCAVSVLLVAGHALLLQATGSFATEGSAAALLAVLLAATVASVAGFAFSAIGAALLLPLMSADPVQVVTVLLVSSIAIQSLSIWALRRSVDWLALVPFLAGGLVGLPVGVWLLLHLPPVGYTRLMGSALVLYGGFMLFRRPVTLRSGPYWDAVIGVAGGVTGGLAAFPGAFVTVWCGMKGWEKTRQRGVYQPFILAMQVLALLMIRGTAPVAEHGSEVAAVAWTFVPAALLGTCCGLAIFRRLSDRQFAGAINLLLIASGLGLLL